MSEHTWQLTRRLRWYIGFDHGSILHYPNIKQPELQQLWVSDNGKQEWRAVPVVTYQDETKKTE